MNDHPKDLEESNRRLVLGWGWVMLICVGGILGIVLSVVVLALLGA